MTKRYACEFDSFDGCPVMDENPDGSYVHFLDYSLVVEALKDLLKHGEHEGDCTNENGEFGVEPGVGPCWKHVHTAENREKAAKLVLEKLGEGDYGQANS